VNTRDEEELAGLEHHWGEAYNIARLGPETWVAQRRDSHSTVGAKTPDGLLERIRQDYLGRPVPRQPAEADA
jgi:hypothetical protein